MEFNKQRHNSHDKVSDSLQLSSGVLNSHQEGMPWPSRLTESTPIGMQVPTSPSHRHSASPRQSTTSGASVILAVDEWQAISQEMDELRTVEAYTTRLNTEISMLRSQLAKCRTKNDALTAELQTERSLKLHHEKISTTNAGDFGNITYDDINNMSFSFANDNKEDALHDERQDDLILKISKRDLDRTMDLGKKCRELEKVNKRIQTAIQSYEEEIELMKLAVVKMDEERKYLNHQIESLKLSLKEKDSQIHNAVEIAKAQMFDQMMAIHQKLQADQGRQLNYQSSDMHISQPIKQIAVNDQTGNDITFSNDYKSNIELHAAAGLLEQSHSGKVVANDNILRSTPVANMNAGDDPIAMADRLLAQVRIKRSSSRPKPNIC